MLAVVLGFGIAVTGVGAGVITAPMLILLLDQPPAVAVGTALAFGTIVKVPALATYVRNGNVDWLTARTMIAWGLPGVVVGGLVLERLSVSDLRGAVLLGVGTVVVFGAGLGLYRAWRPRPHRDDTTRELPGRVGPWSLPIGLEVGFSSAGAGALGTLLLLQRTRLAAATVVGTDLAFGLALAAVGGALHMAHGSWSPVLLTQLAIGGVFGAVAGAMLASRVPARVMRLALLTWLIFVGGHLTWRGVHEVAAAAPTASAADTTR
jgi:hypothetical protein